MTSATQSVLFGEAPAISAKEKYAVVVGGGDTGNDCAGTALRQGSDPRIYETTVKSVRPGAVEIVKLRGSDPIPGTEQVLPCDLLLIAAALEIDRYLKGDAQ